MGRRRSRSASTTTAPGSIPTFPAISRRRARCAGWSATDFRSRAKRTMATRLVAQFAAGESWRPTSAANNGYSVGGAIRVGRALEDLGYWWFEEPVQHYHLGGMGEVARRFDITVSAGEQTYTLSGLADLIASGVRMIQPDIVKMGGVTGLARCIALAQAHGVEIVPHQTQPTIGHTANLHVVASQ